jgi:hypothetical protein
MIAKKQYWILTFLIVALTSCVESTPEDDLMEDEAPLVKTQTVNSNAIQETLRSIPSPIETTNSIERSGASCNVNLLNDVDNIDNYQSTYQKAINLGVYGTDLGYLNLYSKTVTSFEYLDNIRKLSDDLKIGQFFDFATIKRLASNKSNIDSIINISTSGFENMNNYLAEQKRENISTLILVGGWFESVYLLGEIAKSTNNKDLIEKIGEQKVTLGQIIVLLEMYKENEQYGVLYQKVKALNTTFEKVKMTYIYEEPEMKEVDGMLMVVDNSRNVIEVSPAVFDEILANVKSIRSDLIK